MTTNAADALERLEQKWRKQADDNEMNALEADSIGLSDAAKTSDRCAKAFTECANELANIRASLADRQGEAVAWQCRSAWGDGFTEWQECSEEDYEQMAPLLMDCRGEALATQFRALYTHPAPAAVTDARNLDAVARVIFTSRRTRPDVEWLTDMVTKGTLLYTNLATTTVTEKMVEMACAEFLKDNPVQRTVSYSRMRAALTAALNDK